MKTRFFKHVVLVLAAIAGFSAVVMLLWNALVPCIFGLTDINFWQALGLLVLTHLFFGGTMAFAGHDRHEGGFGKNPIRKRWERMTPEKRKEFINKRHEWHRHPFNHHDFWGTADFEANDESKKENE
ncbi:MAG: hypothetical protein EZS26_001363 [Candidatus Ordinivivax streblomastigis]|uniref:Uncharacterized protein n=1 Tax=Candidatus Ordinivivax streblomastigis TaxID=2540710 RepID=A0A5M8P283_9BACT|nr:MAG: hypothetical protein EZS26_001363 [Candidatus Ordinivivax streblomastigis]